jgi:chromosome segregation ATPase
MDQENIVKKPDITYPLYTKTVNDLKSQGQAISVRSVQRVIGGSNSTLLAYQRQWQSEQALAATVEEGISESLKQSLLAEFARRGQAARERFEAQLAQGVQQLKEANELLAETESQYTLFKAQREADNAQHAEKLLTVEKQRAVVIERASELQNQLSKLEQQLKEAATSQEQARIETIKCQLQLEHANKDAEKAEKQISLLERKVAELGQCAHQAEVNAAATKARADELEKQRNT